MTPAIKNLEKLGIKFERKIRAQNDSFKQWLDRHFFEAERDDIASQVSKKVGPSFEAMNADLFVKDHQLVVNSIIVVCEKSPVLGIVECGDPTAGKKYAPLANKIIYDIVYPLIKGTLPNFPDSKYEKWL